MKIASAAISMASQHVEASREARKESLRTRIGQLRPDIEGTHRPIDPSIAAATPPVQISPAGKASQGTETGALQSTDDAVANSPLLSLIKALIESLTGKPVQVFNAAELRRDASSATQESTIAGPSQPTSLSQTDPTPPRAGLGVEYDYRAVRDEVETTRFSAQGTIKTADGRDISFNLDLTMARSFHEETNIGVRTGDTQRKDPLVINFAGPAALLSDQHFRFDLSGNGTLVDLPLLQGNSGFLALDINQNGRIDSGKELFGPVSNAGFAELAQYDQDGNGWIDENDPVFQLLRVWTPAADNDGKLATLQNRNIGALYLGHAGTAFELRGRDNQSLGAVRDSGVYVTESGQVGSLQEIDLIV